MLLTKFASPLILLYRNQSYRKHGQKDEKARIKGKPLHYRALTCFRQFLSPFRPPLMHSICLFVFPLKWKERKIPCCLAGHGQKGVRGGL